MSINSLLHDFTDLVFPNPCPACKRPLVHGEAHLCSICAGALPVFDIRENLLNRFAGRIVLHEARAFLKFYHGGIAQKLLHAIKYQNNTDLAVHLGRLFANHLQPTGVLGAIQVIVPVPLHKSKLRARGYNQSAYLAEGMAAVLKLEPDTTSVTRIRKSATQTKKDRAERWQNVSGIFAVQEDVLSDKHVLLVDDVITTGATLEACGEAILAAGAASLSVAALAAAM